MGIENSIADTLDDEIISDQELQDKSEAIVKKFAHMIPSSTEKGLQITEHEEMRYLDLAEKIFAIQNKIRVNPKCIIPYLKKKMNSFEGNFLPEKDSLGKITEEGPKAYKEAIEFLEKQEPIPKLSLSFALTKASRDHTLDIGDSTEQDYYGEFGQVGYDRVHKYCKNPGRVSESLSFGHKTGLSLITSLIVDDGQKERPNRALLFDPKLKGTGISCGKHFMENEVCYITYAEKYKECDQEILDIYTKLLKQLNEREKNAAKK